PKRCAEILMEKGSQKTQAYPWICRGFLRTLDPQEIGADQDKNRSIQVKERGCDTCEQVFK
ncbi:MAG: hypothetical protein DRI24_12565, partial [Deltaproteobacteria bacterium]